MDQNEHKFADESMSMGSKFGVEALVSPVFDTQIVGKYTERAWTIFTTMSLILAVATRTSNWEVE